MRPLFIPPLLITLSTLIVVGTLHLKVSIPFYIQTIAFLTVVIILIVNSLLSAFRKNSFFQINVYFSFVVLFIATLMVQLLVISTGGLFSPFLILLHLFILGISLLINWRLSVFFIALTAILLGTQILLSPILLYQVMNAPLAMLLNISSLIVIVPFALSITVMYDHKRQMAEKLGKQVRLNQAILQKINEFVIITKTDLQMVSVNNSLLQALNISSEQIINRPFFSIVNLKDATMHPINSESLEIKKILTEKKAKILKDIFFCTSFDSALTSVTLQVCPLFDQENKEVEKIFFIITGT
jgi:hypothetical protein